MGRVRVLWRAVSGSAALVLAAALCQAAAFPGTDAGVPRDPAADPVARSGPGAVVTLVTGDEVTVERAADGPVVTVEAAERPEGDVVFDVLDEAGGTYVIPSDVAPLVPDVLDRELFNVTYLAENGFGDAARGRLPVIAEYPGGLRPSVLQTRANSLPASSVTQTLKSIDGAALTVSKAHAADFWAALHPQASRTSLAAGVTKLWLDQLVWVTLDESVPQIGAPAAWAAGFDGTGVTVAVLDTGIDETHPDVAGKVTASQSFVPGEGVADGHGHGTHVAATVAGTGAGSDGLRKGVAPGAELVIGKVLSNTGSGANSQIIAGMEWAALDQAADIVSMSLGCGPRNGCTNNDGTDPMSQAVNRLSEQTGALFTIAAGNDGPGESTLGTPGVADAALTVGAVDGDDQLAGFSSRGPRLGDYALKPEITAPGVAITAARAAGTDMHGGAEPVDDDYITASGTSMATPHVAGAAAIVAQQHPDWDADELKAALVASAVDGGYTVYQQGAGRLDVARAVAQQVQVSPATVDLGFQPWPQEGPPRTRTLTYSNSTAEPVSIDLDLAAGTVGGDPLLGGALTLDADAVTVPAGGTASVTVTLDHTIVEDGTYTGAVLATGPEDLRLRTPVGFSIGEELYTLDLRVIERRDVEGFENFTVHIYAVDGSIAGEHTSVNCYNGCPDPIEFEVPKGVYLARAFVDWTEQEGQELRCRTCPHAVLLEPEVTVTGDTEVVLDANDAKPVTIDTPRSSEPVAAGAFTVTRTTADASHGLISLWLSAGAINWWITPTDEVTLGDFWTGQHWMLAPAPLEEGTPTPPYVYQLKLYEDGQVPDSLHYRFTNQELATVDNYIHADHPGTPMRLRYFARRTGEFAVSGVGLRFNAPATIREYYGELSADTIHDRELSYTNPEEPPLFPLETALDVFDEAAHHEVRWNTRPLVPGGVRRPDVPRLTDSVMGRMLGICVACRQGDTFYPFLHLTSPDRRHTLGYHGSPFGQFWGEQLRLFRDGQELTPANPYLGQFTAYELPDEPADYRLTIDHRGVHTSWDFASGPVPQDETPPGYACLETEFQRSTVPCRAEPLILLSYDVGVDLTNAVAAPGRHQLEVSAYRQAPGGTPLRGLKLWFSTDGGERWKPMSGLRSSGDGRYVGAIVVPPLDRTVGTVSLRAEAWDAAGNRVEQTVTDAYRLRPR